MKWQKFFRSIRRSVNYRKKEIELRSERNLAKKHTDQQRYVLYIETLKSNWIT